MSLGEIGGPQLVNELARRPRGERPGFVLLTGAGASVEAGVPLGSGIVESLLEKAWRDAGHSGRCAHLRGWAKKKFAWYREWASHPDDVSEYELVIDQVPLSQERRTIFFKDLDDGAKLNKARGNIRLAELIRRGLFRTILTTNFDTVLPRLYGGRGLTEVSAVSHMIAMDPCSDEARLVRLHGALTHGDQSNTRAEMKGLATERFDAVLRLLESHGLVIIGYAGADRRLMNDLFGRIENRHTRKGLFWCIRIGEQPSEPLKEFLKRGLNDVKLVRIRDFEHFMVELSHATAHLRSREDSDLRAERVSGLYFRIAEAHQAARKLNRRVLDTLVQVTVAERGYLKVRNDTVISHGKLKPDEISQVKELRRTGATESRLGAAGSATFQFASRKSISTLGLFGETLDVDDSDGRAFRAILGFLHRLHR